MLWDVIWTSFFTKPVCWQNSYVILEKSYLSHMSSFFTEIWQADRSSSQESKTIEFASNGLLQLKIFKSEWTKVNIGRMQDLSLKAAISMVFLFFIFLAIYLQKGMDVSFLMALESLRFNLQISSSAQNIGQRSNLSIISNLLLFESYIQKCLQNKKQRISRHFIYKTQAKYQVNMDKNIK